MPKMNKAKDVAASHRSGRSLVVLVLVPVLVLVGVFGSEMKLKGRWGL